MKCLACDNVLSDSEACNKFKSSGKPIDLCGRCLDLAGLNSDGTLVEGFEELVEPVVDDEAIFAVIDADADSQDS